MQWIDGNLDIEMLKILLFPLKTMTDIVRFPYNTTQYLSSLLPNEIMIIILKILYKNIRLRILHYCTVSKHWLYCIYLENKTLLYEINIKSMYIKHSIPTSHNSFNVNDILTRDKILSLPSVKNKLDNVKTITEALNLFNDEKASIIMGIYFREICVLFRIIAYTGNKTYDGILMISCEDNVGWSFSVVTDKSSSNKIRMDLHSENLTYLFKELISGQKIYLSDKYLMLISSCFPSHITPDDIYISLYR